MMALIIFTFPDDITVEEVRTISYPVTDEEFTRKIRRPYNRNTPNGITRHGSQKFPDARRRATTTEGKTLTVHGGVTAQITFGTPEGKRNVWVKDSPNEALLQRAGVRETMRLNEANDHRTIAIGEEEIGVQYLREHKERE